MNKEEKCNSIAVFLLQEQISQICDALFPFKRHYMLTSIMSKTIAKIKLKKKHQFFLYFQLRFNS